MIDMYEQIENILVRTLSPYEFEKLEQLKETYSEQQIVNAYKTSKVKNVNYIAKVLQDKKVNVVPEWFNKEIVEKPVDEETLQIAKEFEDFIKEFRK